MFMYKIRGQKGDISGEHLGVQGESGREVLAPPFGTSSRTPTLGLVWTAPWRQIHKEKSTDSKNIRIRSERWWEVLPLERHLLFKNTKDF